MVTTAICFFPVVSAHAGARELVFSSLQVPRWSLGACPDARAGPDPSHAATGPRVLARVAPPRQEQRDGTETSVRSQPRWVADRQSRWAPTGLSKRPAGPSDAAPTARLASSTAVRDEPLAPPARATGRRARAHVRAPRLAAHRRRHRCCPAWGPVAARSRPRRGLAAATPGPRSSRGSTRRHRQWGPGHRGVDLLGRAGQPRARRAAQARSPSPAGSPGGAWSWWTTAACAPPTSP